MSHEDDTAGSVACTIGNAVAPAGYTIIETCPALDTELDMNELIGKTVLHDWDSKSATGCGSLAPCSRAA